MDRIEQKLRNGSDWRDEFKFLLYAAERRAGSFYPADFLYLTVIIRELGRMTTGRTTTSGNL